jgi:hypothetical protein
MKKLLVLFALLAAIPVVSFAQTQPPPGAPPMERRERGMMRPDMSQMMALHKQFRAKVLAAITPAHRNLLASLVGQLAISSNPDPRGAIAKLDAALSSGEKQAILSAAQSFRSQMRAAREAAMAKLRAANPNMPSPRPMPSGMQRERRTPDAGALLFMIVAGGPGPGMMGPHMFGRPMGGFERPGGYMRRPRPTATP